MLCKCAVIFATLMIKSMLRYAIGLVALLTVFSSCKTDINLVGDFEENALVYGLLDPQDNPNNGGDGHLIRIQRSFLGEASAFDMAQIPDSSYFDYESTTVQMHYVTFSGFDTIIRSSTLDTVNVQGKEDGVFFGPEQCPYHFDDNAGAGRDYMLEINNQAMVTVLFQSWK